MRNMAVIIYLYYIYVCAVIGDLKCIGLNGKEWPSQTTAATALNKHPKKETLDKDSRQTLRTKTGGGHLNDLHAAWQLPSLTRCNKTRPQDATKQHHNIT